LLVYCEDLVELTAIVLLDVDSQVLFQLFCKPAQGQSNKFATLLYRKLFLGLIVTLPCLLSLLRELAFRDVLGYDNFEHFQSLCNFQAFLEVLGLTPLLDLDQCYFFVFAYFEECFCVLNSLLVSFLHIFQLF